MARTPSLSAQEAENLIGPRGSVKVTSDNRGLVKKWLVALGLPSDFVGGLSLIELELAYRDDSGVQKVRDKLAKSRAEMGEDGEETPPVPFPAAANAVPASGDAAELAALLRRLMGSSVDENRVREIIRTELPGLIPTSRIELVVNDVVKDLGSAPRHASFKAALTCVAQKINLAIVGPAGGGKTTVCEQIANAMSLPFYMTGAVTGAHDLLGYTELNGRYQSTGFRQAFEHGGVFLCDEVDAGDPAGVLTINSALANGHQAFPDSTKPVPKHKDFYCVAAANTYGTGPDRVYVGRNQLDGATLDRFFFLDFPYDERLERLIAGNDAWVDRVQSIRRGVAKEKARVIVSPRASINGAILLKAGMAQAEVETGLIWRNVDADLRRRIEASAKD